MPSARSSRSKWFKGFAANTRPVKYSIQPLLDSFVRPFCFGNHGLVKIVKRNQSYLREAHQFFSNCRFPSTTPPIQGDNYGPAQFGPKTFNFLEDDLLGNVHFFAERQN